MTNIIKSTDNYSLQVGLPVNSVEQNGEVYQIINKKYGVVEVESTMLPQAIKFLHDLEAGLAAVGDIYEDKIETAPFHPGKSRLLS